MMNSHVTVLILNYNQWEMTIQCVSSVLKSNYNNFSVLVIDNGSQKGDIQKLNENLDSRVTLKILPKNRGYVGGMNYALECASKNNTDYFLVMNNDAIIDNDAISVLVNTAKKYKNKCIVTGKVYNFDQPNIIQHIGSKFTNKKYLKLERIVGDQKDEGQWDYEMQMDMIDDIFWLLPRRVYEIVGGYSHFFWFNAEQADLALRAVEAGNKLIYTPKAKLWHKGSVSIGGRNNNPKLVYYNLQANLILKYLHLPRFRFILYYISLIVRLMKNYLKTIAKHIIFKQQNFFNVKAEYKAICYFNKWVHRKNPNPGNTPFD